MELPDFIEPDQLKATAVVLMVILAIGAFLAIRFVQKVVLKLVLTAALVGTGFLLYSQRDDLDECQRRVRSLGTLPTDERCRCEFIGLEVEVPGCAALPDDIGG